MRNEADRGSLQNTRAVYDKNGKEMVEKMGGMGEQDPSAFFAMVFGGDRFHDLVSPSQYQLRVPES